MTKFVSVLATSLLLVTAAAAEEVDQKSLTRSDLELSLRLGSQFLLNNQTPAGNFHYSYDWKRESLSDEDSQVRQAGAAWGLALIHGFQPNPELEAGVRKALDFMNNHCRRSRDGWRYVVYPGTKSGSTGTVALVTLAHLDYLASRPEHKLAEKYRSTAKEYIQFLRRMRLESGLWNSNYSHLYGNGFGSPSPYFDGESLLALVKAAKYHGMDELRTEVITSANAGYESNVAQALALDGDSPKTKGYYQWGSMAFFELATSDWADTERFGDYVIELADWMIDEHQTLKRTRNTAYAYEGIIHAYQLAKLRNDEEHLKKFGRVIDEGMTKLTSWQVGHPLANEFVLGASKTDRNALGGIQNHRRESGLRIDVTQHQMHAVILALRYFVDR